MCCLRLNLTSGKTATTRPSSAHKTMTAVGLCRRCARAMSFTASSRPKASLQSTRVPAWSPGCFPRRGRGVFGGGGLVWLARGVRLHVSGSLEGARGHVARGWRSACQRHRVRLARAAPPVRHTGSEAPVAPAHSKYFAAAPRLLLLGVAPCRRRARLRREH